MCRGMLLFDSDPKSSFGIGFVSLEMKEAFTVYMARKFYSPCLSRIPFRSVECLD